MSSLYPIQFEPILKSYLWGGHRLAQLFPHKNLPQDQRIAEVWEVADLDSDISVVANGPLKGKTIRTLLKEEGKSILGEKLYQKYQGRFPVMVKLIDAHQDLSLQVHPDDEYAKQHEPGQRGKAEMWYVVEAKREASLLCGFPPQMTRNEFKKGVEKEDFQHLAQKYPTKKGDVFFIPPGTIHAIGQGNILYEIQSASNITYRLYDWGRLDAQGEPRPLHREKALDVLQFDNSQAGKIQPKQSSKEKFLLLECDDFRVEKWKSEGEKVDTKEECALYCIVEGEGTFRSSQEVSFKAGQTFLIPASLNFLQILPTSGSVTLLRILPR